MDRRYLSIDELVTYLGIPKSTLYKKIERQEIPFIRVGQKTIKFDKEIIDAWMSKQAVKPLKRENKFFIEPNGIDNVSSRGYSPI